MCKLRNPSFAAISTLSNGRNKTVKTTRIITATLVVFSLALLLGQSASAGSPPKGGQAPTPTQDFQDVPTNYLFYTFIHNLYVDGIIAGYPCGTPPAGPCGSPPLPYYLPSLNVSRAQMSKYADLGRRSIAVATGTSLSLNNPGGSSTSFAIDATSISTGGGTGYGGRFTNNGGGSLNQYGIAVSNFSTGGSTGVGGEFDNFGGGSGPQYGVYADTASTGSSAGYAGYFSNTGGGSGAQYGVYATVSGTGVGGYFSGYTGLIANGNSNAAGSVGGNFSGHAGLLANGNGATTGASSDGIDVGGSGGTSYAIFSSQPVGDSNYTLYGSAHIHGSNVSAAAYEVEVQYHGEQPAQIGDVLALDGNNSTHNGANVLGVVRAGAGNADAAIGVLSFRLDSTKVNNIDKTFIDGSASQVKTGDRAYITVVGVARMKVSGKPSIGSRVALGSDGSVSIASKGSAVSSSEATVIGKVASLADKDGYVTVFVNLK